MTQMIDTYQNIVTRIDGKSVIQGHEFVVLEDCKNTFYSEQLATIPAGSTLIADFAGDFGLYAIADADGVLHKVKIDLNELHKIDFGSFDARDLSEAPTEIDGKSQFVIGAKYKWDTGLVTPGQGGEMICIIFTPDQGCFRSLRYDTLITVARVHLINRTFIRVK